MCGILGTIPAIDNNIFKQALDTLSHRGPDGFGIWNFDQIITLGHRRLAILDLTEKGKQPMHYADRYSIVFNGEIYNYVELKNELLKKGYTFFSNTDTEVLLVSYIEWGVDCLKKFNGMWAVAIWDKLDCTLFIARDRFGKKPLFYAYIDEIFVFASEMKAIFPLMKEVKPSQNIEWFFKNTHVYEATSKCVIDGIERFPAGHYGFFKNGKLVISQYWNTLENLVKVPSQYEEQVELFRELLIDSCRIRLRSDVPVGSALSGGIDSSAVVSIIAHVAKNNTNERLSNNWQNAFIATFPGCKVDETYYAKKVVENAKINASFVEVDVSDAINNLERYLYYFEEVYDTSPIPMIETYKKMKESGITVSLDGHGGDELLSGYGSDLLLAFHDCGFKLSEIRSILNAYNDLDEKGYQHNINYKAGLNTFFQYKFSGMTRVKLTLNSLLKPGSSHQFNDHLFNLFHKTIFPTLLRNYDRYSMINSVEIRMPLVDHRIVSFLFSLPWDSKIKGGYSKAILRDAVRPFAPKEVIDRKSKIGFTTPFSDWMRKFWREFFLDTINSKDFNESQIINPVSVREIICSTLNNDESGYNVDTKAWNAIMPYFWEKAVIKNYKKFYKNDWLN